MNILRDIAETGIIMIAAASGPAVTGYALWTASHRIVAYLERRADQ